MTTVGTSSSPVDQALLPASMRNGSAERKEQYQAALSFERVLVGQLTAQLMKPSPMAQDDAPASVKLMKESLPSTLADSLMNAGGLGLAQQFDAAWHPEAQTKKTSLSDAAPAASDVNTGPGGGATTS
jgi:hypothetical protein